MLSGVSYAIVFAKPVFTYQGRLLYASVRLWDEQLPEILCMVNPAVGKPIYFKLVALYRSQWDLRSKLCLKEIGSVDASVLMLLLDSVGHLHSIYIFKTPWAHIQSWLCCWISLLTAKQLWTSEMVRNVLVESIPTGTIQAWQTYRKFQEVQNAVKLALEDGVLPRRK